MNIQENWIKPQVVKSLITIFVIVVTTFLLFFHLGNYALWDDEANTALFAQSVWKTGDTHAVLDHNIIAYNNGMELRNFRNRYIPPLGYYVAAPFVGNFPGSSFAARFPFALCGLLTIILMIRWLWKSNVSITTWVMISMGIMGNVSLMLYSRQCRYYSLTILATTILMYFYFHREKGKTALLVIPSSSLLLLAANYMCYVAAYVCFVADYLIWGRKIRPYKKSELLIILVPQIIFGGFLVGAYSMLGEELLSNTKLSWLSMRLNLIVWYLRDLNSCELGVGILIFLAPVLYYCSKDRRLLRCSLAIFLYIVTVSTLSPEPKYGLSISFIRYLAPLIPLCIFTAVLSIQAITFNKKGLAILIAFIAFGTNILHGGPLVGGDKHTHLGRVIAKRQIRSTIFEFVRELIQPPPSAYRITAEWINMRLGEKESVLIVPNFASYPLMYHAPKALYAWQLKDSEGQLNGLPLIHYEGKEFPAYVIAFGPYLQKADDVLKMLRSKGIAYVQVEQIDQYWYDLIRPELFWHSFREVTDFSLSNQAIYIFSRVQ